MITQGNVSSATLTGGTTLTWSHTIATGSNVLYVGFENASALAVNSLTFNGSALTRLVMSSEVWSGYREVWALANPVVTTGDIVITFASSNNAFAGAKDFGSVAISNLSAVTSEGKIVGGAGVTSASFNMITPVDDCMAFYVAEADNGSIVAGTNSVKLANDSLNRRAILDSGSTLGLAGSKTFSFTFTQYSNGGWASVVISPYVPIYAISGEVTLSGTPVQNATVRCIKQSDNTIITQQLTDVNGLYQFSGLDSAELYHLCVEYKTINQLYNSLSYWDIVPLEVI